eukprot:scaffold2205_cov167-Amphora_coffeaeformis.AAC.3
MASSVQALQSAKSLYQLIKTGNPSSSSCRQVLEDMEKHLDAAPVFKIETFTKTLAAAEKTFRVAKRGSSDHSEWDELLKACDRLIQRFKKRQEEGDVGETNPDEVSLANDGEGVPSSVSVYLGRLKTQRKELYKNPPALPPSSVVIQEKTAPLPERDADGFLTFQPGTGKYDAAPVKTFHPNLTPEEILRGGAFGGTYFRSIVSAVTNKKYAGNDALKSSVPDEWIEGLDKKTMLTSQTYNEHVNKFKAKCGGSLGMWESSGWISDADPYGWFQWYCRFYQGRRSSDDSRQIARWKGVAGMKGRFRSQLCNKIISAGATADDVRISPVIRQTLFHWALVVNEKVLEMHKNR